MRVKLYLQRTQLTISSLEGGGGIPKHRGELLRWHALVRRLEAGEQGAVRHRVTDLKRRHRAEEFLLLNSFVRAALVGLYFAFLINQLIKPPRTKTLRAAPLTM